MKGLAIVLAIIFFVIGLLYGLGVLNLFATSGHAHHWSHLVLFWVLGILCLAWARFQSNTPARY
ncbi:MAG: hypothetical protein JO165_01665 [Candidatus Eremiobacteraeota bacterium]|nr:hypothetical protein [Candidatus Eremiobacteraeota bacterium]